MGWAHCWMGRSLAEWDGRTSYTVPLTVQSAGRLLNWSNHYVREVLGPSGIVKPARNSFESTGAGLGCEASLHFVREVLGRAGCGPARAQNSLERYWDRAGCGPARAQNSFERCWGRAGLVPARAQNSFEVLGPSWVVKPAWKSFERY